MRNLPGMRFLAHGARWQQKDIICAHQRGSHLESGCSAKPGGLPPATPCPDARSRTARRLGCCRMLGPPVSTHVAGWSIGRVFPFRTLGRLLYGFVAANRYSLSKCRGGACRVAKPETTRKRAQLGPFWSCYALGFLIRLPLVAWASAAGAFSRVSVFLRTYGKKVELLNGKLTVLFLHGALPNAVPLLFGELFTAVLYDGVAIDPRSPKVPPPRARHTLRVQTRT